VGQQRLGLRAAHARADSIGEMLEDRVACRRRPSGILVHRHRAGSVQQRIGELMVRELTGQEPKNAFLNSKGVIGSWRFSEWPFRRCFGRSESTASAWGYRALEGI